MGTGGVMWRVVVRQLMRRHQLPSDLGKRARLGSEGQGISFNTSGSKSSVAVATIPVAEGSSRELVGVVVGWEVRPASVLPLGSSSTLPCPVVNSIEGSVATLNEALNSAVQLPLLGSPMWSMQLVSDSKVDRLKYFSSVRSGARSAFDNSVGAKSFGRSASVGLFQGGSILIQLLLDYAFLQSPASQPGDDLSELRSAFNRFMKSIPGEGGFRQFGVGGCDPLILQQLNQSVRYMGMPYMPMLGKSNQWRRFSTGSSVANCLRASSNVAGGGTPSSPQREARAERTTSVLAAQASNDTKGSYKSSVDPAETARFAAVAETWWDNQGPYKPLHAINPVRLSFIRAALCRHFRKDPMTARPLEGLRILDVGCGGGLACEPLARMGGQVMGIDAVEKNIRVAAAHAETDPTTSSIEYRYTTAEQLVQEKETCDVVLALEIIEHVADPKEFCKSLASLAKKDGMVVISTINRSITAYGLAIVAAEYVLGWVPKGTHDWFKFVTPEELALVMNEASIPMEEIAGMVYNPVTRSWLLSEDTNVNYVAFGIKRSQ